MGTTCKNALLGNSLEDIEIFPVFSVTCLTKEIITHVFGMPFPPAAVPFWGTGTEEGRTYQTPGPVSELCSLRTMTSHRKPEDGWGHQSLQSGHSCSRQPCLIAPWPASRCHSKNRRERERFVGGLWAVCAVVLKSGNCDFPREPLGLLFSTTSTRKRCTFSTLSGWWCALCATLCRKGWKRIPPSLVGCPSLQLSAGSFVFQHPHLSPGAKIYSRALAMTFPYCLGPRHANLEIKGREGCFGPHRAWVFPP